MAPAHRLTSARSGTGPAGVLVMAYGTPAAPADVDAYYTHIRGGRPPTTGQVADLRARYQAIGGTSPLTARTEAQRAAIQNHLDLRAGTGRALVAAANKHAPPFIEDGVSALVDAGAGVIVGLVLAPHYSRSSVGSYHERAATAAAGARTRYLAVDSWHLDPAFLDFLARSLARARSAAPARHVVLFTAHSLPERLLTDDPYAGQLHASAQAVAERVGLPPGSGWAVCWQSAGATPEPWQGPDVCEVIREIGASGRAGGVVVCPQGFTSDHLEVLYDLDIVARKAADEAGITFSRTDSVNDDARVMEALAMRVIERLEGSSVGR